MTSRHYAVGNAEKRNVMSKESDLEVIREFTDYIIDFVEQPQPEMGNMPVCPFARKARLDGRMRLVVTQLTVDAINYHVSSFANEANLDMMICIHPESNGLSSCEVYRLAEELNEFLPALNVLAFAGHPDDPFNVDGLYTRRDPYPNIQLLRLDVGERAYHSLENSKYYDRWTDENFRDLIPMMSKRAEREQRLFHK